MSICNGNVSESPVSDQIPNTTRSVHFVGDTMDEVKMSSAPVYEAQPFHNDTDSESSSTRLLIQGGQVVNDDCMERQDVFIQDGKIKMVGRDLIIPGGTKVIDAKNKLVMPGGIDPHTHFQFPFMGTTSVDDFYTGTRAALAGGTTMILDFVIDPNSTMISSFEQWKEWATEKACCDFGLHVAVTKWNENSKQEMEVLVNEKGVNSFKVFMCYTDMQMRDEEILEIFEESAKLGAIVMCHAENGDIISHNRKKLIDMGITGPEGHLYSRPETVEAEATNRAIVLADQTNCPLYIVHVMSKSAADVIADMRKKGIVVYGEVIAAALGADGTNYFSKCWQHAAGFILSPPLRTDPTTSEYLISLLSSGGLHLTGSDHCTFNSQQKLMGKDDFTKIPNGVNGVEDRLSILWEKGVMSGILDPCQFVAVTSTNAAKIFNIYPRKGRIQVGADADIVVWDPYISKKISSSNHQSNVDFNIFEGLEVRGVPSYVICNGKLVVDNGEIHVSQGSGQYVECPAFSPYVFARMQQRGLFPPPVNRDVASPPSDAGSNEILSPVRPQERARKSKFEFHSRPPTKSGGRNMQDSSFSLSGAQIDDAKGTRSGIRVNNPPGGYSTGLW